MATSEQHSTLLKQVEALAPWHHDVELAPGLSTCGMRDSGGNADRTFWQHYSPEAQMRRLFAALYPDGLEGRSFLDCACNSGAHTIAAARAGAGRCFAFDARQAWVNQARFLARHFALPNVQVECLKVEDLGVLGLAPFDVTLFSGIFYHLPDPVAGLKRAADLTRELLVLNTSVLPRREPGLMLSLESESHVLSGVDSLAWLPTGPTVLREILAWCGFPHSRIDMYRTPGRPKGWKRIQIVAAREQATLAYWDKTRPETVDHHPTSLARRIFRRLMG
jgi:SAM-dependent methyltransferase